MKSVHVIPVDWTLTAEEAWNEILAHGQRLTYTGGESWAVVGPLENDTLPLEVG